MNDDSASRLTSKGLATRARIVDVAAHLMFERGVANTSIDQVRRDVFRLGRAQQALFAYLDTLAKALLTCVPEPPAEAKPQAVARAKERHDRLLKTAGRAMVGDSGMAMKDLVGDVQE